MTFFRSVLFVCPAACLLAQPPLPKPPGASSSAPPPTVQLSVEPPPQPVPPDKVVITVGSIKLTSQQFNQIVDILPEQYRASARGAGRKQFAENLVKVLVLAQEGKRLGLDTMPAFKTQTEFQADNLLAQVTYDQIAKDTKLDDAALHKYYDDHHAEFEQVHAQHILIRAQGSPLPLKPGEKDLTDAEALAKAQDLKKKIDAGADFAKLAQDESDDTQTAQKGGDLGFFHHGQMVPTFEQAAFALNVGQVSDPVKTPFGYHIIKVEAKQTKTFEEAKPDIEKQLRPDLAKKALDDLQSKAGVVLDPDFFGLAKR